MDPRPRRRRARSARRIALFDQIRALLRDAPRFLTALEVTERLGGGVYYSGAFSALTQMEEEGTVVKLTHPLLRNVLWGLPGATPGFAHEYAVLREERDRLHGALRSAPAPGKGGAWMDRYRDWWQVPAALH